MSIRSNSLFHSDKVRYGGSGLHGYTARLLWSLRKAQGTSSHIPGLLYKCIYSIVARRHGIEISSRCHIGKGLYLGHVYNITVAPNVIIGDNCNLHKGVTIGRENRGRRKGYPTIGNRVWIGINATVVGNVVIGDDVLIAPNSYVNCDVPSHSIVIGNPCVIHHRDNATEGYINNICD